MPSETKTSPAQDSYLLARAAYDMALVAYQAEAAGLDWESDFDATNDRAEDIRARHGLDALRSALAAAEETLIDWSFSVARTIATMSQRVDLDHVRSRLVYHPKHRDAAIESALCLVA